MNTAVRLTAALLVAATTWAAAQEKQDKTVYLNEQQSFTPGYPVGDIALGDPTVADFKVLPGRREILLFGKTSGKTTLTIWDQRGAKRHEILLAVVDRKLGETQDELREVLKAYPGLEVRTLAGQLAITGTVTTEADRDSVERIASASGAQNLVRYNPATKAPSIANPMPQPTGSPATAAPTSTGAPGPPAAAAPEGPSYAVEYELEVLEASVQFGSGSYATGVEPSGRSLFKNKLKIPVDAESEVFVPGQAVMPKEAAKNQPKNQPAKTAAAANTEPLGLHLKLRPAAPDESGSFITYVLIETNLPTGEGSATDPSIMRRARWQFSAQTGEPVGIAGAELLAVADTSKGPSALTKTATVGSFFAALPGISSIPGSTYAGSIPYYDKQHKTQLLLIVRPRLVQGR